MVQRTAWIFLQLQVQKTCSELVMSYWMGKWGMTIKYTFWTVFCVLFHFNTSSGIKTKTWKPYFLNILHTSMQYNKSKCHLRRDTVYC
jgi:hypothetical protein